MQAQGRPPDGALRTGPPPEELGESGRCCGGFQRPRSSCGCDGAPARREASGYPGPVSAQTAEVKPSMCQNFDARRRAEYHRAYKRHA